MAKKMNYDFLESVKQMPPLRHAIPGKEFDISESEAAVWISNQPEVMQKIFDTARYHKAIEYDPQTGKWQGVDYDGD